MIAVIAAGVVIVVAYFVYDRTGSPCESIFEQASTQLSAKLSLLESSGDVAIGKSQIQDLSERSQLVALNLKTCCIVFDGGKLDSEQFLGCKSDAAQYDAQIQRIVALVDDVKAASASGQTQTVATKAREATRQIEVARQSARAFDDQVSRIAGRAPTTSSTPVQPDRMGASQLAPSPAPEPAPSPAAASVAGAEAEPNGSAFEATKIVAGQTLSAEVADAKDSDWYRLQPGSKLRDWITVRVENRSQTLRPSMVIYDANKAQLFSIRGANAGANIEHRFVITPGAEYFVQVGGWDATVGIYALRSTLQQAHDRFEANDDAFTATPIAAATPIDANLMDGRDIDWHRFKATSGPTFVARLENRSTTLRPVLTIYDRDKKQLAWKRAANVGQNLDQSFKVEAGQDYYVVISGYDNTTGAYRLQVAAGR